MDPLTIAGLAMSAAGLMKRLFGGNDREKQLGEIRKRIGEMRLDALRSAGQIIGRQTTGQMAAARQAAAARAMALGRSDDAEAFIAPAEGKIGAQGTDALRDAVGDIGRQHDRMLTEVELEGFRTPQDPDWGDYLGAAGTTVAKLGMDNEYIEALKNARTVPAMPLPSTTATPQDVLGQMKPEPLDEEDYLTRRTGLIGANRREYGDPWGV